MQALIMVVCPCCPEKPMELVKIGGMVYEKCFNHGCVNSFPYDCVIKIQDKLEKYYEENGYYEGFSHYFRHKDSQMRARVLETVPVDAYSTSVTVEVANLTRQPKYKIAK